jgi:eukaryotic-like serine/threonine-protein kinase
VSDLPPLAEGTVVAGKLRVMRLLGAGGMGAVYEVEHEFTKHRRALKLLHKEMLEHPHVVARFLREASAAGHIGNPHIVETFDAGRLETGEPYIVMELLHGETLAARLARKKRLPLGELSDLVRQACDGVQAAHAAGIIHRDLKPDNLFLVERDGKTFVKILDFGISKFDATLTGAAGTTKEGHALGTPYYMSPEQVNGDKDLDARTDVYALGVILYECATGERPFVADYLPKLAVLIHQGTPTPVTHVRPELPPAFGLVVARAMAKDRAQRYASAKELAEDLLPLGEEAMESTQPETTLARGLGLDSRPPQARSNPPPEPKLSAKSVAGATLSVARDRPPTKRRWGTVAIAAAAIAVGVVAVVKMQARPVSGVAVTASPLSAAPEPGVPSAPALPSVPVALASIPTPPPAASPSASASSSPGAALGRPARSAPSAPPTARPPSSATRADQRGLAADNPFQ